MNKVRSHTLNCSDDTPTLEYRDVTKRFGDNTALHAVSVAVDPGAFVVLLGPSGSGKTTLLRCAAGIERVSAGEVPLDGVVVDDGRRVITPERRDLAMVFQDYALWPHMTARQNVAYALKRRHLSQMEASRRAEEFLHRVGLGTMTERYPSELSGGEQQRVALARALACCSSMNRSPISTPACASACGLRSPPLSAKSARPPSTSLTTRPRRSLSRTKSVCWSEGVSCSLDAPRLTGLSGELRGQTIRAVGDGLVAVNVLDSRITARTNAPTSSASDGRILIRRSAVHLLAPDGPDADFAAVVRDVAFCGRGYEHLIELHDDTRLSGVFAENRWDRGARVGVKLNPEGCLFFSDQLVPDQRRVPGVLLPTNPIGAFTSPSIRV